MLGRPQDSRYEKCTKRMEQKGTKVQGRDQEGLASDLMFLEMDGRPRMKVETRKQYGEMEDDEDEKKAMLLLEICKNQLVPVVVGLLAASPTVLVALQVSESPQIYSFPGQCPQ